MKHVNKRLVFWRMLVGVVAGLLGSAVLSPVQAQTLVGEWELRQITFMARQPISDSIQQKLLTDTDAIRTNQQLKRRALVVQLALHADSTYRLQTTVAGEPATAETGTYSVRQGVVHAHATNGRPALFDGQLLTRLTRRALVWEHLLGEDELQVFRQLNYVRVK